MRKHLATILLLFFVSSASAQIQIDQFDLTIETELSDTLQRIYQKFLNEEVEKISIIKLKKRYSRGEHYHFLKHKKWYESEKKWIRENSHEESIIVEGDPYPFIDFESMTFEYEYRGVDMEFIGKEVFIDSNETQLALTEMFNGASSNLMSMCYLPRHAVLFYNREEKISGIYEICFECGNVKIGIVGTDLTSKSSPYLKQLFATYKEELE